MGFEFGKRAGGYSEEADVVAGSFATMTFGDVGRDGCRASLEL
jgi:hypothetical protein